MIICTTDDLYYPYARMHAGGEALNTDIYVEFHTGCGTVDFVDLPLPMLLEYRVDIILYCSERSSVPLSFLSCLRFLV